MLKQHFTKLIGNLGNTGTGKLRTSITIFEIVVDRCEKYRLTHAKVAALLREFGVAAPSAVLRAARGEQVHYEAWLRSEVNIELNFPPKLRGARSRLYRRRFLQVNTRWKALAEIYTMHSFAVCTVLESQNFSQKSPTFFRD